MENGILKGISKKEEGKYIGKERIFGKGVVRNMDKFQHFHPPFLGFSKIPPIIY
jgi:hypothetical protein